VNFSVGKTKVHKAEEANEDLLKCKSHYQRSNLGTHDRLKRESCMVLVFRVLRL
jgi:hypothetical protein